jgi:hypothetical protein
MDMLDNNTFPPNVSLSPMTNSYLPSTTTTHLENNSMMMFSQQTPTHIQHHQNQNSNHFYRQTPQAQQQPMYNNFVQPPPPPPNQVAPGYYPMQQQQQTATQQRMSPANHPTHLNKRQTIMHQPQRTSQQNNQQLQVHMSMNVTLPNVKRKKKYLIYNKIL